MPPALLLMLSLTTLLTACGGGGGSSSATTNDSDTVAEGGIDGTGVVAPEVDDTTLVASVGEITAFGSIFVNGIEYDVDNASISINENSEATETGLKLGMIVRVNGQRNENGLTGTAAEVVFDQDIEGPITSITDVDDFTKSLVILGRSVSISDSIVFENVEFDTLAVGQVLEVSGLLGTGGVLTATRVEKISDSFTTGDKIEVEATITSIDTAAETFMINSLSVDYSQAELKDFPNDIIEAGQFVEVKGISFNESGALIATEVSLEPSGFTLNEGDKFELEGLITDFVSASDFVVSGQQINAENANFADGNIDNLQNGLKVEIDGTIDANNVLQATKVKIKFDSNITIESLVTEVDASSDTLTLLSIEVHAESTTRYQDQSAAKLKFFGLSDIAIGDRLNIKGRSTNELVTARHIKRRKNDNGTRLKGPISSINGAQLVILGVTIDISDADGNGILTDLVVGETISVKGTETSEQFIQADEIERDE